MQKALFVIACLCVTILVQAQVSKTVTVTAGGLYSALSINDRKSITNLTLKGTIDASDFKTMRDNMPLLTVLDLSGVNIAAYTGQLGTELNTNSYPANTIPQLFSYGHNGFTSITIPPSVTSIGTAAFSSCYFTSFTIPSSVISIGEFAFFGCNVMTSITIPSSVAFIGESAFSQCSELISISIPSSLTTIEKSVFSNCGSLTSITIPTSVTTIKEQAFSYCGLTSITIPSSVTSIETLSFIGCSRLALISIPSSITSIEYGVFHGCGLASISIPTSVTSIGEMAFAYCYGLTTVTIPSSVTFIGENAFNNCSGLISISIPSTVTSIGNSAFSSCPALTSIYAYSTTPIDLISSKNVFLYVNKNTCILYVPIGTLNLYRTAYQWKDFNNVEEFSTTEVNSINTGKVTAGHLSLALTANEKSRVTKLIITGIIDVRDFKTMRDEMPLLSELDLSGVSIEAYTGTDGTYLSDNMTYPANELPASAFFSYTTSQAKTSLKKIIFPSTITSIGDVAFQNCSGLTGSLTIPPSVTSIGIGAFGFCYGLTSVFIPASVILLGEGAFYGCGSLIIVDANNPDYSSSDGVLFNKNQTSILFCPSSKTGAYSIPTSVGAIGNSAFASCGKLTSVILPSSVTSIGNSAFWYCRGLTSVVLPASVKSIESYSFYGCSALNSIRTLSGTPVDLSSASDVFQEVDKSTCTLFVPEGSKSAYQAAAQWKDFKIIEEFSTADVELINSKEISIYPNPITVGFCINGISDNSLLSVSDINGKLLLSKEVDNKEYISVSTLPQGIYLVRISSDAGLFEKKLVKKNQY